MEKKQYVRAEQVLINIASDSVLFTASLGDTTPTPAPTAVPCYSDCPSYTTYSILSGFSAGLLFPQYGETPTAVPTRVPTC